MRWFLSDQSKQSPKPVLAPSAASGLICIISFVWPERLQHPVCGVDTLGGRDLLLLGIRPLRAATTTADVREFTSRMCWTCGISEVIVSFVVLHSRLHQLRPRHYQDQRGSRSRQDQDFLNIFKYRKITKLKKIDQNLFLNACLLLNQTARTLQLQPRPSVAIKQLLFENVTCTKFHFHQKR